MVQGKARERKGICEVSSPSSITGTTHFTMQAPANTGGVHLLFFPHIHWVPLETESADAIQIYQTVWLT